MREFWCCFDLFRSSHIQFFFCERLEWTQMRCKHFQPSRYVSALPWCCYASYGCQCRCFGLKFFRSSFSYIFLLWNICARMLKYFVAIYIYIFEMKGLWDVGVGRSKTHYIIQRADSRKSLLELFILLFVFVFHNNSWVIYMDIELKQCVYSMLRENQRDRNLSQNPWTTHNGGFWTMPRNDLKNNHQIQLFEFVLSLTLFIEFMYPL